MPPSFRHDAYLELLERTPELLPKLLSRLLGVPLPPHARVRVASAELGEARALELRADLVVLLEDATGEAVQGIVAEVQLRTDAEKVYVWAGYAVQATRKYRCPIHLLVITPSKTVARWARQGFDVGPGLRFAPWVLGPEGIPVITSPEEAQHDLELAVLSALAHGRDEAQGERIARAVFRGLDQLEDPERVVLYSDMVLAALSRAAREAFLMELRGYKFKSDFFRALYEQAGRELEREWRLEGERKGLLEGERKGLLEGRLSERRENVLRILELRSIPLTEAQRDVILACDDLAQLERFLAEAITTDSVETLFG